MTRTTARSFSLFRGSHSWSSWSRTRRDSANPYAVGTIPLVVDPFAGTCSRCGRKAPDSSQMLLHAGQGRRTPPAATSPISDTPGILCLIAIFRGSAVSARATSPPVASTVPMFASCSVPIQLGLVFQDDYEPGSMTPTHGPRSYANVGNWTYQPNGSDLLDVPSLRQRPAPPATTTDNATLEPENVTTAGWI